MSNALSRKKVKNIYWKIKNEMHKEPRKKKISQKRISKYSHEEKVRCFLLSFMVSLVGQEHCKIFCLTYKVFRSKVSESNQINAGMKESLKNTISAF